MGPPAGQAWRQLSGPPGVALPAGPQCLCQLSFTLLEAASAPWVLLGVNWSPQTLVSWGLVSRLGPMGHRWPLPLTWAHLRLGHRCMS